ncbi:hypothetical protein REPUB_Repub01dG0058800 [Reevesia pubescens]
MGGCFSKKKATSSHHNSQPQPQAAAPPLSSSVAPLAAETSSLKVEIEPKIYKVAEQQQQQQQLLGNAGLEEKSFVKKEIFVIKHRKSHERDRRSPPPPPQNADPVHSAENESASSATAEGGICNINTVVRTSSCTKEEVDAILIQCGRLSRSNSSGKTPSKKYSGSKRSYDFDNENENDNDIGVASSDYGWRKKGNEGLCDDEQRPRHRQSSRSSSSSSQSQGRRRTPSRERERDQRSGSRERGSSSNGGRRVSLSPGRRSELNTQGTNAATNRPGKMVSVPATVSSLVMDKSSNANGVEATNAIKRISVKRNAGVGEAAVVSRTTASPRSQSPAKINPNAKGCNENQQQQQPICSRSSSRKAEHSPYRRNPLSEIDPNSLAYPQSATNKNSCYINKGQGGIKESTIVINQKPNVEMNHKVIVQGSNHKAVSMATMDNRDINVNSTAKEPSMVEEVKAQPPKAGADNLKPQPQPLTRSRSSRRSRDLDLDLNPETSLNPIPIPSSYTTLLLEDIQNFHQNNNPPSFSVSLPPCVSKACSILEAVADLNSTTSSNLSSAFSEDRKGVSLTTDESNKNGYNISVGRKMTETRDPFVESEVVVSDDLMEPSFHKYVTVRRGGADVEEQESSGSNSIVGCGQQQNWGFSSADSTDRWTSRTKSTEEDYSGPLGLGLQRHALGEPGSDIKNSTTRKGLSGRRETLIIKT